MPMIFDARQYTPTQGFPAHPPGKFRALISNTERAVVKDNPQNGMFVVEFQTDQGRIAKRYNLWNQNAEAVRIANNELSALCFATGVYQIDLEQDGAQLRNAQCYIEVGKQAKGDYMEVARVYDLQGNEPGKAPQGQLMAAPAQPQQMQPAPTSAQQPQFQPPMQPQTFQQPAQQPQFNPPPGSFPNPGAAQPQFQPPQQTFQAPPQQMQPAPAAAAPGAPWNR